MKYKSVCVLKASLLFVALCSGINVQAKVKLPTVFSDNMVLQQKTKARIWGKTDAGKSVTIKVSWSKNTVGTKADANGDWIFSIPTPSYGGPYTITINDGEVTTLNNVLIGEVWICSGQSNMEMPLAGWGKIDNYQKEIEAAVYPNIRLLQTAHVTSNSPLEDVKVTNNGWTPCTPQFVADFSSVAYFFAREVYKKTGIPIGLIHTSWGGTIAEAWTSGTTLKNMPDFAAATIAIERQAESGLGEKEQISAWQKKVFDKDAGYSQGKPAWLAAAVDDSSWKQMPLPGFWEQSVLPDFDGVVYLRKKITIPASWAGKEIKVNLGTIDDNDLTYFDGEKIGETEGYNTARLYTIPADKVKAGEHVLSVRIFDGGGGGGIYGERNILALTSAGGEKISLDGDWGYKIGLDLKDVGPAPASMQSANRPTVLYNAMINPYIKFAIRGAIWYQGESNAERAHQYRELFPAMIKDWRKKWNIGDFPFYFVQLANYMKVEDQPVPSAWAELRDAQLGTFSTPSGVSSSSLANTGMAVTTDIGNDKDIHPKNKQEVGRRLALIALAKTYGKNIPYSGPLFTSQKIEGKSVRLNFKFTDGGLIAKEGILTGFAIAGADQKFHWAKAVIQGNQILVSSADVPNPVAVRYAWANNPVANLYNGAGLPASPFKTDNWQDVTFGKK